MKPELNLMYLHSEHIGYGQMGTRIHEALSNVGVKVFDGLPGSEDLSIDTKYSGIARNILFCTAPNHIFGWWEGQHAHLFTMWETNDLPDGMRERLHNFDTILVPSQSNVELFSRYHDNVVYIPLGVDGKRWHYRPRREDIFFNFLIAGSGTRKGTDLVHRAFMELFAGKNLDPIPRLLMKNPKGESFSGGNVEVISGHISPEEEVDLYASAHCYVQPSRGEGWGMQPLQAMAQGIPTILTNAHGHEPFAQYGIPLQAELAPSRYMSMFGDSGNWWEPNYDQLCAAMWLVYNNFTIYRDIATRNSDVVRREFDWRHCGERIVDVIGEDNLTEDFDPPPTKWSTPDPKLFRVITLRDWKADIGGIVRFLEKGKEYWVPVDVKRILFEGGALDPVCLDNTDGLTELQLERLGIYIKEYSKCPTCGHSLNDDTDLEDDDPLMAGAQ